MPQFSSPLRRPQSQTRDDSPLPQGQCRYLLLHPEVRGQRCACVGFSINKSTPGSSCNCGHLAVYHLAAPAREPLGNSEEMEAMQSRIARLEKMLERETEAKNYLTVRVSALEEHNEKGKMDVDSEIRNVHRGLEGLWRHFHSLDKRTRYHDDCVDALMDSSHATQGDIRSLQSRIIDIDDASMILEDRIDSLSSAAPERVNHACSLGGGGGYRTPSSTQTRAQQSRSSQSSTDSRAWTVHISLMPTSSQPFPFEKDTMAYKRVLSRGLHRIVAIPGPDSHSFVEAISREFAHLLKGRPWKPLVAKICDAEHVTGLPMLRQLPPSLIDSELYDLDFLTRHCATLDHKGNILDLYIAMCDDSFTWPELQASPVFISGLEACWDFDPFLDGGGAYLDDYDYDETSSPDTSHTNHTNHTKNFNHTTNTNTKTNTTTATATTPRHTKEDLKTDDRHSAGDLLRAWSPPATRLKRTAPAPTPTPASTAALPSTPGSTIRRRSSSFGSSDCASSNKKKTKIGHHHHHHHDHHHHQHQQQQQQHVVSSPPVQTVQAVQTMQVQTVPSVVEIRDRRAAEAA